MKTGAIAICDDCGIEIEVLISESGVWEGIPDSSTMITPHYNCFSVRGTLKDPADRKKIDEKIDAIRTLQEIAR